VRTSSDNEQVPEITALYYLLVIYGLRMANLWIIVDLRVIKGFCLRVMMLHLRAMNGCQFGNSLESWTMAGLVGVKPAGSCGKAMRFRGSDPEHDEQLGWTG
jgi:hypothetical protein